MKRKKQSPSLLSVIVIGACLTMFQSPVLAHGDGGGGGEGGDGGNSGEGSMTHPSTKTSPQ